MLNFLPGPLLAAISFSLLLLNTFFWCLPLYAFVLAKLLPIPAWRRFCTKGAIWCAEAWISGNSAWMWLTQRTEWRVTGLDGLDRDEWYLVISNHLSWTDIFALQHIFNRRIPFLKFFIKQELIWLPVIGLAWWGLDFPFMKRYSKEQIRRNPELRGKDLETTRKACERFKTTPVSVMNFLEGTRYTPAKHERQNSPYDYLLLPKAGGIAFVLAAMDDQIDTMLDVTIAYPEGVVEFWGFLGGKLPSIEIYVQKRPIPPQYCHGDYSNDPDFRAEFQTWVSALWQEKDARLARMLDKSLLAAEPIGRE